MSLGELETVYGHCEDRLERTRLDMMTVEAHILQRQGDGGSAA